MADMVARIVGDLHVIQWGQGPRVVLVHGSVTAGEQTWAQQRPLAERWRLIVPDRPGFGRSAPLDGAVDFEADAPLIAELLGSGSHLVGHSYGGIVSMLAAARRPDAVRSLTVVEPPCFAVAAGEPSVDALVESFKEHWRRAPRDPATFLRGFAERVGMAGRLPSPLPPQLEQGVRLLMDERGPWEAQIPFDVLVPAPFPKLVVSGGHHPAFDAVCDVLERRLGAERVVVAGAGHSVQRTGEPFNKKLEAFLTSG
jgi:pimeloyl-ACP methyl ester carboxylesterase